MASTLSSSSDAAPTSQAPSGSASMLSTNSISMSRRSRAQANLDISSNDDDAGQATRYKKARKSKAQTKSESPYTAIGAAVGLMGDLFRDFQAVLDYGLQSIPDTPQSTLSAQDRKYLALYQHITSISPRIVDDILKRGTTGSYEIARELEAGRSSVRGVDIHNIKKAILTWDVYDPPIPPEAKSVRGFNHPLCGRLLCPPQYNWSDPEKGLQNQSKKYPVRAKNFPRVLWLNEEFNRDNPTEGFGRNRRLILIGRYCLLGPIASTATGTSRTPTRKPKAKIHRIRSITPAFIAYTALLVHLSLHSQESFGDGSTPGTFPYEEYYQRVVRYINEVMTSEERADLLTWWTTQMFGSFSEDSSAEESGEDESLWAFMKKQAAVRAQAAVSRHLQQA